MDFHFNLDGQAPQPVYRQLKNELHRLIREQEFRSGDLLPSVQTLADAARVSVRTMDHALRELIRDGVCYRRPKKGTFVGARPRMDAVEQNRKQIVILYVPTFGLEYFNTDQADRSLYAGMRREATKRGVDLLLINDDLEYYLGNVAQDLHGVLLLESEPLEEIIRLAELHPELRFVYANYFLPGFEMTGANVFGVFNDDFGGAFQISSYFFSRGCRNVRILAFVTGDLNYAQRLRGFEFAADQFGVSLEGKYIELPPENSLDDMLASGYRNTGRLLKEDPGIDLILCTCDFLGFGAHQYLLEHDSPVRLAGYDGYRLYGNFPEFPTMQIDFPEIGAQALNIAVSRKNYPKQVKIFPNFINNIPKAKE